MPVLPFHGKTPKIGAGSFIAPDAWIIGDVEVGEHVTILFGAVLRGDLLPIRVGDGSNIQEHSMLHTTHGVSPCIVGRNVTIGHRAIVHGCRVDDDSLVGMGATILDGAVIEREAALGAHSLLLMNIVVPAGHLFAGVPASDRKILTDTMKKGILEGAEIYRDLGTEYRKSLPPTAARS